MPAISVGSVEVDVVPNAQGVDARLRAALVPPASRIGDEVGRIIGRQIVAQMTPAITNGINAGARAARPAAARQGDETAGAFGRTFRARLTAAMRDLPRADVRLSDTGFNADLARLRARMETLSNKRIGVDVDAATALAEIDRIEADLRRLGAQHPNVQVRVDTAASLAQLAALREEVNRLDGQTARVDVDTSSATASLGGLTAAAIAFGPAILPVLPVVAAGLGSVAAAAVAAGAGLGGIALVAVPAIHQISTVLQAQKAAQEAATNAAYSGAQVASQAASRSLQQASAAQALATAERNGARQIAQARQSAADAASRAAQQVQAAERALADAQRAATQAQQDLTDARKQAAQELLDLNNQLADSQLSQRDAEIQLKEATAQRDAVLKNANSTELDKQKALLAYDQAVQRLKEQTQQTDRLKTQTAAANKAGVDGSKTVKDAQDKLADAQRNVADRTQALKQAQTDQARAAVQGAQQVATAQQNAADAIASAQRQVAQAQLQSAGGSNAAATAQAKYRAELAKLSPAARATLNAYTGLRDAFSAWSRSLQPAVLPIFTRALNGVRNALPKLTPFVYAAADAITTLQDKAAQGFKSKWWTDFVTDLQTSVRPAILGFGIAFGNIFKGIVLVIDAFLPRMDSISSTLQRVTGRFSTWAQGLKGSPEFERFLSYSAEHAPLIGRALGAIAGAFLNIGEAISPLSGPLLVLVTGLAKGVGWLAANVPGLVPVIYGLYVATKLWTLAQWALNAAMEAFQLISKAGPWGWIVLGIVALVLVIGTLYKKCDWFRAAVQVVWKAIKTAALTVRDWFAGPFARFWTQTLPRVFSEGWTAVKQHVLYPLRDFFTKTVPGWAATLGRRVSGAWSSMGSGISSGWTSIKQHVLYPIKTFFTSTVPGWGALLRDKVVDAFKSAASGIGKAWDKIRDATKKPINFVLNTVWNKGIVGAWAKITGWIPGVPKLGKLPLLASGGTLPVQPGVFNRPTAIVGEGNPRFPEFVIPTDPKYRGRATALWQAAGTQLLAGGGIIGDIVGGITGIGSKIGSALGSAASFLANPGKALDKLLGKLLGPLQAIKNTSFGKLTLALPKLVLKGLKSLVTGASGGGAGDLAAHGASAKQAQNIARLLLPSFGWGPEQMPPLIKLWNGESGWRWNALNASSGAYGIPQALPASKMASAGADWRTNAATQIRWGLGYIKHRPDYGSPAAAWSKWLSRSPHWYDQGGFLQPGMNLAFNGTGRPEPVFTTSQANALMSAAKQQQATTPVVVELHPQEGAFGHWVDVRIQDSQQQLVQVLNAS